MPSFLTAIFDPAYGVVLAALPDMAPPTQVLKNAVPGLAGIAGFLLFPTAGAWLRLLLEFLEWNRPIGIGKRSRIHGLTMLKAISMTLMFLFFLLTWVHAVGELRDFQSEAPVVAPSLQGLAVGFVFWVVYGLAWSALMSDYRRRRNARRVGGVY